MSHFRIALRHCLAQPGFSAIILVTIASTIGAAAAVFSLFDAALLRPFPYHQAERLVRLQSTDASDKASSADVSLYNFEDFRSRNRTLQGLAAYTSFTNQLTGMGQARSIRMTFASAGCTVAHTRICCAHESR